MDFMAFGQNLRVDNALIDHEHQILIDCVNRLHDAIVNGDERMVVAKTLNDLIVYTQTHFYVEEELMRIFNYPAAEQHRQAHQYFKEMVLRVQVNFQQRVAMVPDSLLQFLKEWLSEHFLHVDKALADFLRGKALS